MKIEYDGTLTIKGAQVNMGRRAESGHLRKAVAIFLTTQMQWDIGYQGHELRLTILDLRT